MSDHTEPERTFTASDALSSFIKFADDMRDIYTWYNRPAYAETCPCGASVEVGNTVDRAEQARIRRHFQGRHFRCLQQIDFDQPGVTVLGQVGNTEEP